MESTCAWRDSNEFCARRSAPLVISLFSNASGLASPEDLASIDFVEPTLERLPAIDLEEFCTSRDAFEAAGGEHPTPQAFHSPLDPKRTS
jgi:hypothetical protein